MSVIAQAGAKGRQLHKFGGSSLADAKCYLRVAGIMKEYSQAGDMMVVSAAGSTTNQLISWLKLSQSDRLAAHQVQQSLRRYQTELIGGLVEPAAADTLIAAFIHDLERLAGLLDGGVTEAVYAEVVGHGEVWSARLMAAVLNQLGMEAAWLDARAFLRAERAAQPQVDEGLSYPLLQQLMAQHPNKRLVVTGFISRNQAGETVLLGRNGSDYSATQIGALAGASRVTIWSDVAGVYSADPRKVKDACLLPLLRLDEASELARLAAPVLHARTLQPVSASDIDLQLRCSYTPEQGSTRIERVLASGTGARIVTSHDDVCLVEFQVPASHDFKLAHKELDALLKRAQLRPLAVGVHADRKLLQFCYTSEVADSALKLLDEAGLPGELRLRQKLALVAMVGAGVTRNPLHCHRFWQQLKGQPVEFTWQSEEGILPAGGGRSRAASRFRPNRHRQPQTVSSHPVAGPVLTAPSPYSCAEKQPPETRRPERNRPTPRHKSPSPFEDPDIEPHRQNRTSLPPRRTIAKANRLRKNRKTERQRQERPYRTLRRKSENDPLRKRMSHPARALFSR